MSNPSNKIRGFTTVELLVTLAIAAILMAVAAPSLRSMFMLNRVQGAASEFQSALMIARAEAIKRGGDARVTIVANSMTGGTPDWTSGLTVFYDETANANGNAPTTDGSKLIMKTSALPDGVAASVNFNHLIYNGRGRSISSSGGFLSGTAAFGTSESDWRCLIISISGRVRSETVSNAAYLAVGCPTN